MSNDISNIEYLVRELMNTNNTITAVTYTSLDGNVIYQTLNWDISSDIIGLLNSWRQQSPSVVVQGIKYSTLQCTPERLVSTNILGQGHIVASNERDRILLAYVTPDGGAGIAYMDLARTLSQITGGRAVVAESAVPVAQPQYQEQQSVGQPQYQEQQSVGQPQYQEQQSTQEVATGEARQVPKSTWASGSPDTEMKNIIWEIEEFRKYVEQGNFTTFLRNLLTEGDQVKIWEILKLIRHFKSLSQLE